MSADGTSIADDTPAQFGLSARVTLGLALLGLCALYFPTYIDAWNSIWQTEDLGHGPIILCVVCWLFWTSRGAVLESRDRLRPLPGGALLLTGLALLLLGRIFNVSSVEFGSHVFVISGLALSLAGFKAVRGLWFPIAYLAFLIPLPSVVVDYLTQPLKEWISVMAVNLLHLIGYPSARSGVVISVGQYQLLVADACAGMHSMFSLAALGVLYLHLMRRPGAIHNGMILMSILPIAFMANFLRVILLILITYHLGDEAGQGFLHGAAGMLLWVFALVGLFAVDRFVSVFNFKY